MRSAVATLLVVSLGWLLFGCLGLLWTIAFTADARSMTIGLVVWVFCFVAPSMLATVVACRVDEREAGSRESPRTPGARRSPMPGTGG